MKADKNTILGKLSSACCSPWKSTYVELPEYNTIVLAAYYTGEESSINPVKGYKIYLAILYKSIDTNKDTWCIMTNSGSKVNYNFSLSTIDEKSTPFTFKNTQEMDKFFGYSRDITDRIIKSSLDKNDSNIEVCLFAQRRDLLVSSFYIQTLFLVKYHYNQNVLIYGTNKSDAERKSSKPS